MRCLVATTHNIFAYILSVLRQMSALPARLCM
jgi:hypothetical protein